jgi:hypothetical protein
MKVFISGSISIKKLPMIAAEKIDNIIMKNYMILIGDAKGVDSIVQKYLQNRNYSNVIVYYAGEEIRNNYGKWNTTQIKSKKNEKGRKLYTLKDMEMANDSDYGLMIWDGMSDGTLNNISMMKTQNKRFFVIIKDIIVDEKHIESLLEIRKKQINSYSAQVDLF